MIAADKIPEIGGVVLKDLSLNSAALAKLSSSGTGVAGLDICCFSLLLVSGLPLVRRL